MKKEFFIILKKLSLKQINQILVPDLCNVYIQTMLLLFDPVFLRLFSYTFLISTLVAKGTG